MIVEKTSDKLPKLLRPFVDQAFKHARRQGYKIPDNLNRFFEDWYMYMWIYNIICYGKK